MNTKERWDTIYKDGREFTTFNEIFLDELLLPLLSQSQGERNRKCLDVGCGTGDVLSKMMRRGYEVWGVDASEEAVRLARARTGLGNQNIFVGDIDDGALEQLNGMKFDLIIIKLVIAFIKDKGMTMTKLKDFLEPAGKQLVITPLIYEGATYTKPHTRAIAINEKELMQILNESFSDVKLIHRDFLDDNGVLGYYLCSN